ncbi:MAG TPA: hypothetical protein VKY74_12725, partial [Chloroflexia bacterium]|nr:hypothetical protein [Chloroflexia bacterium]
MRQNPLQSAYHWLTQVAADDPNIVRRARLLNVVIVGVLALMALLIPTIVFGTNMDPAVKVRNIGLVLALIALSGGALQRSRQGAPRPAAYLFLAMVWLLVSIGLLTQPDQVSAVGFVPYLYTIPIVTAGLTADRWAPFLFAGAATGPLVALAYVYPPYQYYKLDHGAVVPDSLLDITAYISRDLVFLLLVAFLSFMFERTVATALAATGAQATSRADTRHAAQRRQLGQQLATTLRHQTAALAQTVQQQHTAAQAQAAAGHEITGTLAELAATARQIAGSAHDVRGAADAVLQSVEAGQAGVEATTS